MATMATTTKSNRKKPVRSASASRAAKTSNKRASRAKEPITTKVEIKSSSKKALTPLERIRSIHVSLALMYAVFAVLVGIFAKTAADAVTLGHQTRDEFAGTTNVVLGPSSEVLYNLEPKYVLVLSLLAAAVASLLIASKLRTRYEASLATGSSAYRWVSIGVSSALLLTFLNMLGGIHDFATLKLSAALILVTTFLAWIAERENAAAGRPRWQAFTASLFTGALAWLPLAGSLIGTSLFGMERYGWHVYALAAVSLIGFTAFAVNQYRHIKRGRAGENLAAEEAYMRIDMLTKFAVVLIVLLAFK